MRRRPPGVVTSVVGEAGRGRLAGGHDDSPVRGNVGESTVWRSAVACSPQHRPAGSSKRPQPTAHSHRAPGPFAYTHPAGRALAMDMIPGARTPPFRSSRLRAHTAHILGCFQTDGQTYGPPDMRARHLPCPDQAGEAVRTPWSCHFHRNPKGEATDASSNNGGHVSPRQRAVLVHTAQALSACGRRGAADVHCNYVHTYVMQST